MSTNLLEINNFREKIKRLQISKTSNFATVYNLQYLYRAITSSIMSYHSLDSILKPLFCQTNYAITVINQPINNKIFVDQQCSNQKKFVQFSFPLISFTDLPLEQLREIQIYSNISAKQLTTYSDYLYTTNSINILKKVKPRLNGIKPQLARDIALYPRFFQQQNKNFCKQENKVLQKYQISPQSQQSQILFRQRSRQAVKLGYISSQFSLIDCQQVINTQSINDFLGIKLSWLEASIVILKQVQVILNTLLQIKNINYLILDDEFTVKNKFNLSTKEKKASRVGPLFSILIELAQFLKKIINQIFAFIFNKQNYQNTKLSILSIYSTIANNSGIYRYKYKISNYINCIKCINELRIININIYKLYYFKMFQDLQQIMQQYSSNYLKRMLNLYENTKTLSITKQRVQNSLQVLMDQEITYNQEHLTQAWKLFKQKFIPYYSSLLKQSSVDDINLKVQQRWIQYSNQVLATRKQIYFNLKTVKYQCILDNFNQFKTVILKEIIDQDEQNYQQILKLENKQMLKVIYNKGKLKFEQNIKIQVEDLLKKEVLSILESILLQMYSQDNNIQINNYVADFQNNQVEFLQQSVNIISQQNFIQKLDFYDYQAYVQVIIVSSHKVDIINQILVLIFCRKFSYLFSKNSLSFISAYDQYCDICNDVVFSDNQIQIISKKFNILYNINLKFLLKILQLFFDDKIAQYIYKQFSGKYVFKSLEIELKSSIFINHRLFLIPFIIISYLVENSEKQISILNTQSNFTTKEKFLSLNSLKYGYFINNSQDYNTLSIMEQTVKNSTALDMTNTSNMIRYLYLKDTIGYYSQKNQGPILQQLYKNQQIISIYENKLSLIGFLATKLEFNEDKYQVSPEVIILIKSQLKELFLHKSSSIAQNVDKFNRIVVSVIVYFRQLSDEVVQIFNIAQQQLIRQVQKAINTFDQKRFHYLMFILPQQLGGLGILNFNQNYPQIINYIQLSPTKAENKNKIVSQFFDYNYIKLDSQMIKQITVNYQQYFFDLNIISVNEKIIQKYSLFLCSQQNYTLLQQFIDKDDIMQKQQICKQYNNNQTKAQYRGQLQFKNKIFISFWSPIINRSEVFLGKKSVVNNSGIQFQGKLNSLNQFYSSLFKNNLWIKIHSSLVKQLSIFIKSKNKLLEIVILEKHDESIFGIISSPLNKSGVIADMIIKDISSNIEYFINIQLIFTNFDQFKSFSIPQQQLDTQNKIFNIYIDLVYCRVQIPYIIQLDQYLPHFDKQLRHILNTNDFIKLLRDRVQNLLQIQNFQETSTETLDRSNWKNILLGDAYYVQQIGVNQQILFIVLSISNKVMWVQIIENAKSKVVVQQFIRFLIQKLDSQQQVTLYSEDPILKKNIEEQILMLNETIDIKVVISYLVINLQPIKYYIDLTKKDQSIEFISDISIFGGKQQQFFRFLMLLIVTLQSNPTKAINYSSSCKCLQNIQFYKQSFNKQNTSISLSDFDRELVIQTLSYFKQRFNRLYRSQDLLTLLLGIFSEEETKTDAIFVRDGNTIVSQLSKPNKIDFQNQNYKNNKIQTLVSENQSEGTIYIIPNNLNQFIQQQNQNYSVMGKIIDGVIEVRALVKNLKQTSSLQNLGFFGEVLQIQDYKVTVPGQIIFTSKFQIQLLQQIGSSILPLLFIE